MSSLVEFGPVVLEKTISSKYFDITLLSPWKEAGTLNLKKIESHSPKDALEVWLKLTQWFWSKKIYISSMYFSLFRYLSLGGDLPLNKLEFPKNAL